MNLSSYLKELFIDFVKSDILHIQMSMSIHRKRILEMLCDGETCTTLSQSHFEIFTKVTQCLIDLPIGVTASSTK